MGIKFLKGAKECPMCGTNHSLEVLPDKAEEDGRIYAYHVYCHVCGCHGRNNYPIGWCETPEQAIEAWNHRGSVRPEFVSEHANTIKFSIEPHGPEGQFALYLGRTRDQHGARLCNLYDFDTSGPRIRSTIVGAMNDREDAEGKANSAYQQGYDRGIALGREMVLKELNTIKEGGEGD